MSSLLEIRYPQRNFIAITAATNTSVTALAMITGQIDSIQPYVNQQAIPAESTAYMPIEISPVERDRQTFMTCGK